MVKHKKYINPTKDNFHGKWQNTQAVYLVFTILKRLNLTIKAIFDNNN